MRLNLGGLPILLVNVDEPVIYINPPNSVVRDSAASRNSVVAMPLSFEASIGTSTKDFRRVSNHVPPGGIISVEDILRMRGNKFCLSKSPSSTQWPCPCDCETKWANCNVIRPRVAQAQYESFPCYFLLLYPSPSHILDTVSRS